jgi:hypothetical protein
MLEIVIGSVGGYGKANSDDDFVRLHIMRKLKRWPSDIFETAIWWGSLGKCLIWLCVTCVWEHNTAERWECHWAARVIYHVVTLKSLDAKTWEVNTGGWAQSQCLFSALVWFRRTCRVQDVGLLADWAMFSVPSRRWIPIFFGCGYMDWLIGFHKDMMVSQNLAHTHHMFI